MSFPRPLKSVNFQMHLGHRPVHPAPRDRGQKLGAASMSMSARAGGAAAAEPKLGHGAAAESKLGPGSRAIYTPRIVVRMRGYDTIRKRKRKYPSRYWSGKLKAAWDAL